MVGEEEFDAAGLPAPTLGFQTKSKQKAQMQKSRSISATAFFNMVGEEGFEPPTLWSQTRCATKLRYSPRYLTGSLPVDGAYNTESEFIRKRFFHYFLQYYTVRTKDNQAR